MSTAFGAGLIVLGLSKPTVMRRSERRSAYVSPHPQARVFGSPKNVSWRILHTDDSKGGPADFGNNGGD